MIIPTSCFQILPNFFLILPYFGGTGFVYLPPWSTAAKFGTVQQTLSLELSAKKTDGSFRRVKWARVGGKQGKCPRRFRFTWRCTWRGACHGAAATATWRHPAAERCCAVSQAAAAPGTTPSRCGPSSPTSPWTRTSTASTAPRPIQPHNVAIIHHRTGVTRRWAGRRNEVYNIRPRFGGRRRTRPESKMLSNGITCQLV